ncbi:hypothetical protein FIBSPDRAFT_459541 [Athelia psychrophila]|uniref:Uncharacterized protein n=1 Tax=Athelia psychrophila TaxID=1759441 RepID=A0A166LSB5_9AGAM|nr:hypothetical protein FIBSPDRAFT_459541 [Fibularhizoctonia sp. CBS 109695]
MRSLFSMISHPRMLSTQCINNRPFDIHHCSYFALTLTGLRCVLYSAASHGFASREIFLWFAVCVALWCSTRWPAAASTIECPERPNPNSSLGLGAGGAKWRSANNMQTQISLSKCGVSGAMTWL